MFEIGGAQSALVFWQEKNVKAHPGPFVLPDEFKKLVYQVTFFCFNERNYKRLSGPPVCLHSLSFPKSNWVSILELFPVPTHISVKSVENKQGACFCQRLAPPVASSCSFSSSEGTFGREAATFDCLLRLVPFHKIVSRTMVKMNHLSFLEFYCSFYRVSEVFWLPRFVDLSLI